MRDRACGSRSRWWIWSSRRRAQPNPFTFWDRVDLGSVSGLSKDATVRVFYSVSDPRVARIAAGTSTYAVNTLAYFLGLTYGLAALIVLVVWPVIGLAERVGRRFLNLGAGTLPDAAVQQISRLPCR